MNFSESQLFKFSNKNRDISSIGDWKIITPMTLHFKTGSLSQLNLSQTHHISIKCYTLEKRSDRKVNDQENAIMGLCPGGQPPKASRSRTVTKRVANTFIDYRQVSYIRRTLVGNLSVDHSDVVAASPVGAAPTTSSLSTSIDWAKTTVRGDENNLSFGIWCALYQRFYGNPNHGGREWRWHHR